MLQAWSRRCLLLACRWSLRCQEEGGRIGHAARGLAAVAAKSQPQRRKMLKAMRSGPGALSVMLHLSNYEPHYEVRAHSERLIVSYEPLSLP